MADAEDSERSLLPWKTISLMTLFDCYRKFTVSHLVHAKGMHLNKMLAADGRMYFTTMATNNCC